MEINFRHEINGQKVITAIAQDWKTGQILMVANMNKDALQKTIETGKAHYWSTSRNSQWLKGESSGHTQEVKEILVEQLGINEDDVELTSSLVDDLGADSLDAIDIVMSIEDEYSIEVPDETIEQMKTVEDIVNFIENNMGSND